MYIEVAFIQFPVEATGWFLLNNHTHLNIQVIALLYLSKPVGWRALLPIAGLLVKVTQQVRVEPSLNPRPFSSMVHAL